MQQARVTQPGSDLRVLIANAHGALLHLRRRQYALHAFHAEVERVSRGATFDLHNDVRWIQLLDFRDKNVIDLASWAKGHYSPGGLFGAIQADHLRSLSSQPAPSDDSYRDALQAKGYAEARARLFGANVETKVKPENVAALRDAFANAFAPVVQDRHENRAHLYEKNNMGTAKMLALDETHAAFEYAHRVLNDLSLLGCASTNADVDLNVTSVELDAEDLADELLIPRYARRLLARSDVSRDVFYDALHAQPHDAAGKPAFNSREAVERALVALGIPSRVDTDD